MHRPCQRILCDLVRHVLTSPTFWITIYVSRFTCLVCHIDVTRGCPRGYREYLRVPPCTIEYHRGTPCTIESHRVPWRGYCAQNYCEIPLAQRVTGIGWGEYEAKPSGASGGTKRAPLAALNTVSNVGVSGVDYTPMKDTRGKSFSHNTLVPVSRVDYSATHPRLTPHLTSSYTVTYRCVRLAKRACETEKITLTGFFLTLFAIT